MIEPTSPMGAPAGNEPLVAVVTPFYNTDRYLEEAIQSVLRQTYRNFEYLLLDNRSTDRSLAIARHYEALDPRIRVITNTEFLDQDRNCSEAFRLIGPGAKYVKMVMADDWIFPRCLEEMVGVAERAASVGIVSGYCLKGSSILGNGLEWPSELFDGKEIVRLYLQQDVFLFGSPTTVLFRADVVRNTFPFFESGVPFADTEACCRTLRHWDFGFVHQVLSFLRVEADSISGRVRDYSPNDLHRLIVVRKFGRDFLNDRELEEVNKRITSGYFRMLGLALLTRRDAGFWDYHRWGLATVGVQLRRPALLGVGLFAVARRFAAPFFAVARAIKAHARL